MRNIAYGGGIREILARADALERSGRNILHMEIGRPDLDSPKRAKDAVIRALEAGDVHYTDMTGSLELRREIAAKYKREAGIDVDPEMEIIVTAGAIEALMMVFMTMMNPGEEVLIPAPYFPPYGDQIKTAGCVLRGVPCKIENGFRPQPQDIEEAVTPQTRIILLNSPNNPTGAVLTRKELLGIADVARKHDLLVISDECYEKFIYDSDTPHISMASLPGMRERVFTLSAVSKTFSMTGWRIGWLLHPAEVKPYLMKCHQGLTTCANSFAQAGAAEALRSCASDVEHMIEEYKRRRDLMVSMLSAIDGIDVPVPGGAFYVFPSIKRLGIGSIDFCRRLLDEEGVSTVPGQPFGVEDGYLRITYCRPEGEIREAISRMADFAKRLRAENSAPSAKAADKNL
jgi:aspartate aminotransferase/aminotransferase